jgi:hypothetical protein
MCKTILFGLIVKRHDSNATALDWVYESKDVADFVLNVEWNIL